MDAHRKVMFVDDEEGVRRSWDRYLTEAGFDVETAVDGETAIHRLSEKPVDVVVSDLKMPGMDGVRLLEWIRGEQPDTQFILLTGYGDEETERRVRELGAFEYLNKPIDPETLSALVTAASILARKSLPAGGTTEAEETVEAVATAEPERTWSPGTEAEEPKSRLRAGAEVAAGLVVAPLLGLAFVVFLPIVGFGALLWTLGEKGWEMIKPIPDGQGS